MSITAGTDATAPDFGETGDAGAPADAEPIKDVFLPQVDAIVDASPFAEPLTLNSVVPSRAPTTGGTPIRVIGTGFAEGVRFELAGRRCRQVEVVNRNLATCVTPPGDVGVADVRAEPGAKRLE